MYYRSSRRSVSISVESESPSDRHLVRNLHGSTPSPGENLMASERFLSVHRAIESLKQEQKAAITLRYFEGMGIREIAQVLGRRDGTVKSILHRALQHLRSELKDTGLQDAE